jgi:septum formation protein
MSEFSQLILASASPRRQHMLSVNRIPFTVMIPDSEEIPEPGEQGKQYVLRNAKLKAATVAARVSENNPILSADTIVLTKTGKILEKPQDAAHAKEMLQQISNDFHLVLTGYALYHGTKELVARCVETKVYFRALSIAEIEGYIQTGESFDKAGAYAIQGAAMGFVERIEGSYTNVMGLPLTEVLTDLKAFFGITPFSANNNEGINS